MMKNSEVASQFMSLLMPNHGHTGVVYRVNEYVCATSNTELPAVVHIVGLCAIHNTEYSIFIEGEVCPYLMGDSGRPDSHLYSHSYIVTPSQNTNFCSANTVRRVILCLQAPDDCSAFIVVDHLRPRFPISAETVNVPHYPEQRGYGHHQGHL